MNCFCNVSLAWTAAWSAEVSSLFLIHPQKYGLEQTYDACFLPLLSSCFYDMRTDTSAPRFFFKFRLRLIKEGQLNLFFFCVNSLESLLAVCKVFALMRSFKCQVESQNMIRIHLLRVVIVMVFRVYRFFTALVALVLCLNF